MTARYTNHRAKVDRDGHLYLRRDLIVIEPNGKKRWFPQHARVVTSVYPNTEKLIWVGHEEGGQMTPLIYDYEGVSV